MKVKIAKLLFKLKMKKAAFRVSPLTALKLQRDKTNEMFRKFKMNNNNRKYN